MDNIEYFKNAFVTAVCQNRKPEDMKEEDMFLGTPNGHPAYAYIRVADLMRGHNSSATIQLSAIGLTAQQMDLNITWERVYHDKRPSQNLSSRPAIKALLNEIAQPKSQGRLILVASLWDLTRHQDEWLKFGNSCLRYGVDIMVCGNMGYLLSMALRIVSPETPYEEKVMLMRLVGWEGYPRMY